MSTETSIWTQLILATIPATLSASMAFYAAKKAIDAAADRDRANHRREAIDRMIQLVSEAEEVPMLVAASVPGLSQSAADAGARWRSLADKYMESRMSPKLRHLTRLWFPNSAELFATCEESEVDFMRAINALQAATNEEALVEYAAAEETLSDIAVRIRLELDELSKSLVQDVIETL